MCVCVCVLEGGGRKVGVMVVRVGGSSHTVSLCVCVGGGRKVGVIVVRAGGSSHTVILCVCVCWKRGGGGG